jgi:heat shock protein HslJ/chaperonin cofactor prefoldin
MNRSKVLAGTLGAALLVSALPGLAVAQEDDSHAAEGIDWTLSSYVDAGVTTDVPSDVTVTLHLDAGEASGNAGCNSYFGSYEIGEDTLSFGPLASTKAFCEGSAQTTEDAYLALLGGVAGWTVEDGTLSLSGADDLVTLIFAEAAVDITASDIDALMVELAGMQAQIDAQSEYLAGLDPEALNNQVAGLEASLEALQKQVNHQNVPGLRERVKTNEAALIELTDQVSKLRSRVKTLEEEYKDLNKRVEALEG